MPRAPGGPADQHTPPAEIPAHVPACAGCGSCCHFVVELRPADDVPAEFIVEHGGVRCLDQRSDGACVALDPVTRRCTIYERRPQTCRDFSRGTALCLAALTRHPVRPR